MSCHANINVHIFCRWLKNVTCVSSLSTFVISWKHHTHKLYQQVTFLYLIINYLPILFFQVIFTTMANLYYTDLRNTWLLYPRSVFSLLSVNNIDYHKVLFLWTGCNVLFQCVIQGVDPELFGSCCLQSKIWDDQVLITSVVFLCFRVLVAHDSSWMYLWSEKFALIFQFDREQFEEKFVDMKWFESKKGFTFGNNPVETKVQ